jgi:hypothetical protein
LDVVDGRPLIITVWFRINPEPVHRWAAANVCAGMGHPLRDTDLSISDTMARLDHHLNSMWSSHEMDAFVSGL